MTPWHRYWFQHGDEAGGPSRDAALWTPQALAETQRAFWQQAAQATEAWWRYWSSAWPGVPTQPPAGSVTPLAAAAATPAAAAGRAASTARPARKTSPPRRGAAPPARPRPQRAARGK